MNIKEFLNSPGITIKNPNKKSKKDKQPDTITLPFTRSNTESIYSQANEEFDDVGNMLTDIEDPFKYDNYGITLTRKGTELKPGTEFRNLDFELADAQSNWTKAGNAVLQTVVDEVIGGSVQGFSDMAVAVPQGLAKLTDAILDKVFDIKGDKVQDALGMKDEDYSNPVSAKIQEWRDKFSNEVAPIYATPGVDISNGGLGDFGWWMSNMPSIMSSITLMIPTRAATAGIGKLAGLVSKANTARKATKAINKAVQAERIADAAKMGDVGREFEDLNVLQKFIYNPINRERLSKGARDVTEAALMRTIENYQEAHQSYQDTYANASQILGEMSDEDYNKWITVHGQEFQEDGININDKDAVAKHIATKAADRTFVADYSNMVFDFIQLHSLKDIGRLSKNVKSPSVERMHRASKAIAGKSDDVAKETIKRSTVQKVKDNVTDWITGTSKKFLAESTEGIEEGINYIAQQEGITYGNTLLSLENDTTKSSFWNDRINDYMVDSQFWESAFWGVLGGVVFGGGMNKYQSHRIAQANKKLEKFRKENNITGEKTVLDDFISLGEMPEIQAAKEAINRRQYRASDLAAKLKLITDGKNPNIKDPDTGQYADISNDPVAQELAKQELIHKFRTELAFDALNSGTYDLLVDYLQDKNVQQMFIDAGATTQEDLSKFIQETISDLDLAKNAYHKELAHVNHQVTALNASKPEEGKIPLEYVQHIARVNAEKRMQIARFDRQLAGLDAKAAELEADEEDSGNIFNTKQAVRLAMLLDQYSRLEADKKALQEDDSMEEWAKAENIKSIENQQDAMLKSITDTAAAPYNANGFIVIEDDENLAQRKATAKEQGLAAALYAIRMSKTYKRLANSYTSDYSNPDFAKSDEDLIKEYDHIFKDSKTTAETLKQLGRLIDEDLNTVAGTSEESLYNRNKKLYDLYTSRADIEIQRDLAASRIARSQSQIAERVDEIHNRSNKIREAKIDKAQKVITELHTKYRQTNAAHVELAVISAYRNNWEEAARLARENLTGVDEEGHSDAEKLLDAIKIINFSAGSNQMAFSFIMEVLRKNAELYRKQGEIFTTFQERQEEPKTIDLTDTSANQENNLFAGLAGENEPFTTPKTPVTAETINDDARDKQAFSINVENGKLVITPVQGDQVKEDDVITLVNSDGTEELAISAEPKEKQTKFILNPELFGNITIDVLNPDIELSITSNPVIEYDTFNKPIISEIGRVTAVNKSTGEQLNPYSSPVERNDATEQPATEEPSNDEGQANGEEQPTIQPIVQSAPQPSISSTGEEVNPPFTAEQREEFLQAVFNKYFEDNNLDIDSISDWGSVKTAIMESLQPAIQKGRLTVEEANRAVDDYIKSLSYEGDEPIDTEANRLILHARYEEPSSNEFGFLFKQAAKGFIDEYMKRFVVKDVNGKPGIRIKDIIALCKEANPEANDEAIQSLYNVVVSYLTSEEGQKEYTILDIDEVRQGTLLESIATVTQEAKETGNTVVTNPYRLAINDYMTTAAININALKPGDKLNIEIGTVSNRTNVLFRDSNGVLVGRMPQADHVTINGMAGYFMYNEGWCHDVVLDASGNIHSNLLDIFSKIFFDNSTDFQNIRQNLAAYNSATTPQAKQAAINNFRNNPYIQQLVQQSIKAPMGQNIMFVVTNKNTGAKSVNYNRLFNGLLNVWNYAAGSPLPLMQTSLNNWFRMLYETYKQVDTIVAAKPNSIGCEVAYTSDGALSLAIDAHTANVNDKYDSLPLASEGIADKSTAKIAIVTKVNDQGKLAVQTTDKNNPQQPIQSFSVGSTIIAIMGPSGKYQFAKAYGVRMNDINTNGYPNDTIKNLVAGFGHTLQSYLKLLDNNTLSPAEVDDIRNKLKGFLNDLLSGSRIGLLRAFDGQTQIQDAKFTNVGGGKGIEISIKHRDGTFENFQIMTHDRAGNVKLGVTSTDPNTGKLTDKVTFKNVNSSIIFARLGQFLLNYQFDISAQAIKHDNGTGNLSNSSIFSITPEGKLKVTLKNDKTHEVFFEQEYDDYNSFILDNDLVRVNLKKETDEAGNSTNFTTNTSNQRENKVVKVRFTQQSATVSSQQQPVATSPIISSNTVEEDFEQARTIFTQDSPNKMFDAIRAIMPADAISELESVANEIGLEVPFFPERIIYREDYNFGAEGGFIATTNVNTRNSDIIHVYENNDKDSRKTARLAPRTVVVGNKFLNMLTSKNKERRNRALRKMMHEQLHLLLHDSSRLSDQERANAFDVLYEIFSIYNAKLVEDINNSTGERKTQLQALHKVLSRYTTDKTIKGMHKLAEEFMVEGMTNTAVYDYLNSIEYVPGTSEVLDRYSTDNTKQSLFSKFMDFIARLFGFTRRNDKSLNEKLYQVLQSIGRENTDDATLDSETGSSNTPPVEGNDDETGTDNTGDDNTEGSSDENEWNISDDDFDDGSRDSAVEEPYIKPHININGLDFIRRNLPTELHKNFDNLVKRGYIELKCS